MTRKKRRGPHPARPNPKGTAGAKSPSPNRAAARRTGVISGIAVGVTVLLVLLGYWLFATREVSVAVPNPDLTRAERQVTERIVRFRSDVERNPGSAEAWGGLGMTLHIHQFIPDAVQAYAQAQRLSPRDTRWSYFSAIALHSIGLPDAIDRFERTRRMMPDYVPLLVRYGRALTDHGRLVDAERILGHAIAIEPRSSHARVELARIALARDDLDESVRRLVEAVEIDPRYGEVHGLLAEVHRRRGEPVAATRASRRARLFAKTTPLPDSLFDAVIDHGVSSWWYRERGGNYMGVGLYRAAADQFRRALAARTDAETHYRVGLALQYAGELDSAVAHHRAALTLRPDYPQAIHNLGTSLFEMGRMQEGIAYVEQARQLDPSSPDAYLRLGILYERTGACQRAIDRLRQGLERAGYDDRLAVRLGWLLATASTARFRDGAEAIRLVEPAAALTVYSDLEALDVLAAAYATEGRFADAVDTAERAVKLAMPLGRGDAVQQLRGRVDLYRERVSLGRAGTPAIRLGEAQADARGGGC